MLLIPSLKKKTKHGCIDDIADPVDFYIPLDGYRNVMAPVVEIGEKVMKYQLLAECTGIFAARVHAPVSGTVIGIFELNGRQLLHLQNDFLDTEMPRLPLLPTDLTPETFSQLLFEYGIEGAGGSGFPTALKYRGHSNPINTLIFNGVECEPYLSADYVLIRDRASELLRASEVIRSVVQARQIVFAIERQNIELKKILLEAAAGLNIKIEVKVVPDTYPQGGELQLIKSVTGMEIRKGSIPAQYGILVNNTGTLWAIYRAIFEGLPNTERILTVSGNGCLNTGNFRVKIGTPVFQILRATGNSWDPEKQTVVLGGAMMGKAVASPLVPVHKGSGGLLVMTKNSNAANNCIKCGVCVDVCPQHLMPLEFVRHGLSGHTEALRELHLPDCIECGACAYVCPSDVPLMESIFDGKAKLLPQPL